MEDLVEVCTIQVHNVDVFEFFHVSFTQWQDEWYWKRKWDSSYRKISDITKDLLVKNALKIRGNTSVLITLQQDRWE